MADQSLWELLAPHLEPPDRGTTAGNGVKDSETSTYLDTLSTLSLSSLTSTEPQELGQAAHSTLLSLQKLANRSHKSIITSSDHLSTLRLSVPQLVRDTNGLHDAIPRLDEEAVRFSSRYSKSVDNSALERRKKAMLLARNVDRLSDILDIPTLLSSTVAAAGTNAAQGAASTNYSSALDLFAHTRRLQILYPNSALVRDVAVQAEEAMKGMTTNLIANLRSQNIRLAAAMRTIGWLRRVAPELESSNNKGVLVGKNEGALGALFLACRLANLTMMLDALEPLRELAEQESQTRSANTNEKPDGVSGKNWSRGQQTERYLKRYIEIFREQSFAMVSLYKSIFPSADTAAEAGTNTTNDNPKLKPRKASTAAGAGQPSADDDELLQPLPSALATFPHHLVDLLTDTLRQYLPNVQDRSSRESLLTQVLYCAGSLGRLGGDFSMILASLAETEEDAGDDDNEEEWVEVMKKHRVLAGRLELLASGVGTTGASNNLSRVTSPT